MDVGFILEDVAHRREDIGAEFDGVRCRGSGNGIDELILLRILLFGEVIGRSQEMYSSQR